uniref:Macaca fascicularis brain cDNA clone: QflA-19240, similar to human amyotrophic lateral sclerosis 2 (juvenile) (ALS2), mRNA, RefSeq: NM_020919.2 n=1 Tax=Macaca fascicularis TaxID=9541 RepID=I7GIE2_MACFA|nr:unnamed protein product [Macaca fascicularis]
MIGYLFVIVSITAQHLPHQTNLRSSSRLSRRSPRVSWHHSRKTSCGPWMTCFPFSCMWCYGPGNCFLTLLLVSRYF